MQEIALGLPVSGTIVVPGVLTWGEYCQRRATWDPPRATVGLDAEFYKGPETLLFPPSWLNEAARAALLPCHRLSSRKDVRYLGVDPAEGGDDTAWCVIDWLGVIELVSKKTSDTSTITSETLALIRKHSIQPQNVCFDRGGG